MVSPPICTLCSLVQQPLASRSSNLDRHSPERVLLPKKGHCGRENGQECTVVPGALRAHVSSRRRSVAGSGAFLWDPPGRDPKSSRFGPKSDQHKTVRIGPNLEDFGPPLVDPTGRPQTRLLIPPGIKHTPERPGCQSARPTQLHCHACLFFSQHGSGCTAWHADSTSQ